MGSRRPDLRARADHGRRAWRRTPYARLDRRCPRAHPRRSHGEDDPPRHGAGRCREDPAPGRRARPGGARSEGRRRGAARSPRPRPSRSARAREDGQARRVRAAVLALAGAGEKLTRAFFARSVHEVASELIGATLLVDGVGGTIVEVEAYDQDDPASHGFRGRTARTASMFGPPGYAYVYRSYGVHWCLNLVCAPAGRAEAALVRALEPVRGLEAMRERRGLEAERALCSGPGKLCQALGITRAQDGLALDEPPFELLARESEPPVAVGARIGITRAVEQPWRYCLAGPPFLTRPLRSLP